MGPQSISEDMYSKFSIDDDRVKTIDTGVIRISDFSLHSLTTVRYHRFNEEKQEVSSWHSFFTPIITSSNIRRVTEFSLDCCPLLRKVYSREPGSQTLFINQATRRVPGDFRKPRRANVWRWWMETKSFNATAESAGFQFVLAG